MEEKDLAAALPKLGKGDDTFTKWSVQQVKDIHGIDLTQPMKMCPAEVTTGSR